MQDAALGMVQHGVDYVRACFVRDPTNFGGPEGDVYVYQVGDLRAEMDAWRRPEDVKARCLRTGRQRARGRAQCSARRSAVSHTTPPWRRFAAGAVLSRGARACRSASP